MRTGATAIGLAALLAVAGCGSSDSEPATTTTTVETAQKPAPLPSGWTRRLDNGHGFSMGLPPGWTAGDRGDSVLFRSPDHLVAVSVSVDRTADAFQSPVAAFARQTLTSLPGYRDTLRPGPPEPVTGTPLEGVIVRSKGTTTAGSVPQDVAVAVLRRDRLVNYTAVVAANSRSTPPAELGLATQLVRTIRDLPIA